MLVPHLGSLKPLRRFRAQVAIGAEFGFVARGSPGHHGARGATRSDAEELGAMELVTLEGTCNQWSCMEDGDCWLKTAFK